MKDELTMATMLLVLAVGASILLFGGAMLVALCLILASAVLSVRVALYRCGTTRRVLALLLLLANGMVFWLFLLAVIRA